MMQVRIHRKSLFTKLVKRLIDKGLAWIPEAVLEENLSEEEFDKIMDFVQSEEDQTDTIALPIGVVLSHPHVREAVEKFGYVFLPISYVEDIIGKRFPDLISDDSVLVFYLDEIVGNKDLHRSAEEYGFERIWRIRGRYFNIIYLDEGNGWAYVLGFEIPLKYLYFLKQMSRRC